MYAGEAVCTPISTVRLLIPVLLTGVHEAKQNGFTFFSFSRKKKISRAEEETPLIKSLPCKGETCIQTPSPCMKLDVEHVPINPELRGRHVWKPIDA